VNLCELGGCNWVILTNLFNVAALSIQHQSVLRLISWFDRKVLVDIRYDNWLWKITWHNNRHQCFRHLHILTHVLLSHFNKFVIHLLPAKHHPPHLSLCWTHALSLRLHNLDYCQHSFTIAAHVWCLLYLFIFIYILA